MFLMELFVNKIIKIMRAIKLLEKSIFCKIIKISFNGWWMIMKLFCDRKRIGRIFGIVNFWEKYSKLKNV